MLWLLVTMLILAIPLIIYSSANWHRNYYFGLTGESGTNLLGKLVQYQLIPKEDPKYQKIISKVTACTGRLAADDVFTCVWDFLPKNSVVSKYSIDNMYLDSFTKKYILKNLPTYLVKSVPVAVAGLLEPANSYLKIGSQDESMFLLEERLATVLNFALFFGLVFLIPLNLIIKPRQLLKSIPPSFFILLLISLYYIAITGLAAINDYQRIVSPVLPLLVILLMTTTDQIAAKATKLVSNSF